MCAGGGGVGIHAAAVVSPHPRLRLILRVIRFSLVLRLRDEGTKRNSRKVRAIPEKNRDSALLCNKQTENCEGTGHNLEES